MTLQKLAGASDIGPAGQRVLCGVAQLGLDGRAYAPSSPASPATEPPEGANPSLGPLHALSVQSPQLELWALQDRARAACLCRCPGGEFLPCECNAWAKCRGYCRPNPVHRENVAAGRCVNRGAKCGLVPRVEQLDLPLTRSERGAFTFGDVVLCGHWTCPNCGTRFARETANAIDCLIKCWLTNNGDYHQDVAPFDVWMLTLTNPHDAGDADEVTLELLYRTWEIFVNDRAWRRWSKQVGVKARLRALDVTFGGRNGTHPHFHVALFVDNVPGFRWGASLARSTKGSGLGKGTGFPVPTEILDAWIAAARTAGVNIDDKREQHMRTGRRGRPVAVQLQGADAAAAYFTKWGLSSEAGASALKKEGPLALLRAGDTELYRAFRIAVGGLQVVTGLERAMKAVGVTEDACEQHRADRQAFLDEQNPPTLVTPLSLVVRRCLWSRAITVGFGAVVAEVDRADQAGEDVQGALDAFLWRVRPEGRIRARAAPS